MPFITQGKTNRRFILIVAVLAIFVAAEILIVIIDYNSDLIGLFLSPEINKTAQTKKGPSPETSEYNVYYITIARKQNTFETKEWFTTYLAGLLNLPFKDYSAPSILSIIYDTRDGSPGNKLFDFSYYIFLQDQLKRLNEKYEDENVIVNVANVDRKLIPYLINRDYCEDDIDCSVRESFCSYGAFNHYELYMDVWGCEWTYYPQENQESLNKMCDTKTQHPEVKYTGSKCINNQCVAQGKTVTCEEGIQI